MKTFAIDITPNETDSLKTSYTLDATRFAVAVKRALDLHKKENKRKQFKTLLITVTATE